MFLVVELNIALPITLDVGNLSSKFEHCTVFAARCCISAAYAVMRCLFVCDCVCVCVSVTFLGCVKTNKRITKFFTIGSHTILVFPCQTA